MNTGDDVWGPLLTMSAATVIIGALIFFSEDPSDVFSLNGKNRKFSWIKSFNYVYWYTVYMYF